MAGPILTGADVVSMLDKIEHDASLPAAARQTAVALRPLALGSPAFVQHEIGKLWRTISGSLACNAPATDLYRCVTANAVQKHMARDPWPAAAEGLFALAVDPADPSGWIRAQIEPGTTIFPALRSWLLAADIGALDAAALHTQLELRPDVHPPFVLFRLSLALMAAGAVAVRLPNALDAAAGGQPQWNPAGLAIGPEYVDRDVPIEAVEEILWRP